MTEEPQKYKKLIRGLRIILVLFASVLLIWLIDANFALRGVWRVSYNNLKKSTPFVRFEDPNPFFGYFNASQKLSWALYNDLTKFHVKLPVSFEKMELVIDYQNRGQGLIYFESQSRVGLENKKVIVAADFLDEIDWPKLAGEDFNLWQKGSARQFLSLEEFLSDPPAKEKILNLNYDTMPKELGLDGKEIYGRREKEFSLADYDYVVADYQPSGNKNSARQARFEFDLKDLFIRENNFYFNLYAPGLAANQGKVEINKMEITAFKKPVWQRL